ncbi:MAG: cupin domain-containing protein [Acidimicrobiia bacterium]
MAEHETRDAASGSNGDRASKRGITVYRAEDGVGLFESGTMAVPHFDPEDQAVLAADGPRSKNTLLGDHNSVLFRGPGDDGFSLVKAWFAPGFVLPRHSHDGDCLYYVEAGSVTMGSQVLQAGDGFFVPDGAPYAYEAGPDGVTVLEFRTRTSFGMDIKGGQVDRLRKLASVADERAEEWAAFQASFSG